MRPRRTPIARTLAALFLLASLAAQAQPPTAPDPLRAGSVWRGTTQEDNAAKTIRLVARNAQWATFELEGFSGDALFRLVAEVTGNMARIESVARVRNPKGSGSVTMTVVHGSIRVADGKLSIELTARMRAAKSLRTWTFTCASAAQSDPASQAADKFAVGLAWRGKADEDGQPKDIRVVERRGDLVVFLVQGFAGGAEFHVAGHQREDVVIVDSIRRVRNPSGGNAVAMTDTKGTVRAAPGNCIRMRLEASMKGSRTVGWTLRCTLARPQ